MARLLPELHRAQKAGKVTDANGEIGGWLARQLELVESLIDDVASAGEPKPSFHDQLVSRRSKRLRSLVLLLASRAGDPGRAIEQDLVRAAATVELLHEGTLYHDDIVDLADRRRGLPTTHAVHGPAVAALAGSELLYRSAELVAMLPPASRRAYGRAGDALCRGQLRELEAIGDQGLTPRQRIRIMRDKTAGLFAFAAATGAQLGGARPTVVRRLRRFGLRFGLCYQLADDLRDLTASEGELGREPGADLADGVMTLPILLALAQGGPEARAVCNALRRPRHRDDIVEALGTLRAGRGIELAEGVLHVWAEQAVHELTATALEARHAVRELHDLMADVVRLATGTGTAFPRITTCTM